MGVCGTERVCSLWCEGTKAERMSKYFFWLMLNIHPKNFVESEYVHINIDFIHVLFHFEKWWREKKLKFLSTCRNAKRSSHKSFYCEAFKLSHKNFNMPHNSEDEIDGFRLLAFRSETAEKARVEKKYESEISSVAHSYLVSFHFDKCSVVSRFFAGWIWIDSELRLRDWQGEWREERKYIKLFHHSYSLRCRRLAQSSVTSSWFVLRCCFFPLSPSISPTPE